MEGRKVKATRIYYIVVTAILAIVGFSTVANANTFDGTDMNPGFQTGLTEVYAVTTEGIAVYVPVWSMEDCTDENAEFQDACVWQANVMGNGVGDSIVYLGGDTMAYVSHEAARIMRIADKPVAPTGNLYEPVATETVQTEQWAGAPCDAQCEADMASDVDSSELAEIEAIKASDWTLGYPPCVHEDGSNSVPGPCYWDASERGNHIGVSFVDHGDGTYDYGKY